MSCKPETIDGGKGAEWQISAGPFGRGDVAFSSSGETTDIVAPPGVPLMNGAQLVIDLLQWRWAQFRDGSVTYPINISLEEAVDLVGDQSPWVMEQQVIHEIRDDEARRGQFPEF